MGTAAPVSDGLSAMVTPPPKKKFGGGKIIATILGFLVLVSGIAGGVILTQQNQQIKEKAAAEGGYRVEYICKKDGSSDAWCLDSVVDCPNDSGGPRSCDDSYWNGWDCTDGPHSEPCSGIGGGGGGGGNSFSCKNINAYSAAWASLSTTDLAKYKAGDTVNFCAAGEVLENLVPVEAARFTINGTQRPETTDKRPGGGKNEFCDTYVIPTSTTVFNVSAEVKVLGKWK